MKDNMSESIKIVDRCMVCPYCLSQVNQPSLGHCGESMAHIELGYILADGTIVLASEYNKLTGLTIGGIS